MTKYSEYIHQAEHCKTYEEAERLLAVVENDESISDRKYYDLRHYAFRCVYENQN